MSFEVHKTATLYVLTDGFNILNQKQISIRQVHFSVSAWRLGLKEQGRAGLLEHFLFHYHWRNTHVGSGCGKKKNNDIVKHKNPNAHKIQRNSN